jgi:uncharacterized membrane protein
MLTHGIHVKGFSSYTTGSYAEGLAPLRDAIKKSGQNFSYIRNHEASELFPTTMEQLKEYDVIIFSDLPADTLLLNDETFIRGKKFPNRHRLIVDWVKGGGGFLMVGGYMSFSGFEGKANYHFSPLSEILPVKMYGYDDRIEMPEGVSPNIENSQHPILKTIPTSWPFFLGYNKLIPNQGDVLMTIQGDPFLSVCSIEKGRVGIFASDCSPHWAPEEFTSWKYYEIFWNQLLTWLANCLD